MRKQIEEPFGWIKTVGGLRKQSSSRRGLGYLVPRPDGARL